MHLCTEQSQRLVTSQISTYSILEALSGMALHQTTTPFAEMLLQTSQPRVPVVKDHPALLPILLPNTIQHFCSASIASVPFASIFGSTCLQRERLHQHFCNFARARPKQLGGSSFAKESLHGPGTYLEENNRAARLRLMTLCLANTHYIEPW